MKLNKKYIQNIISAKNNNSLAIFVGAGVSKSADTDTEKFPTWENLIEGLKGELKLENEHDNLKIAQLYFLNFEEFEYYKKIKEYFPEYTSPSTIHKLIFDINPHFIITTNWDNLLEKTIDENAHVYDVICSDSDLVKSSLPNKLIKMHGDFKNHNIVFKEDDYLKYSQNFPLIENYVKSILSTHTVLFIGYSYNDVNLKQVINWLQYHSKVRPLMYLVTVKDKENEFQIKYLENHGIKSLVINEINKQKCTKEENLDDYSKKLLTFLYRIKDEISNTEEEVEEETIDFIFNKLKILDELEGILIKQIEKILPDLSFIYQEDYTSILRLKELSNLDEKKPSIIRNNKFREILNEIVQNKKQASPKVLKIFKILNKAKIKGIIISKNDSQSNQADYLAFLDYLKNEDSNDINTYLNFDFKVLIKTEYNLNKIFELALKFYNLGKFESAFDKVNEVIETCLKQKNYTKLFIAMFNRNILQRRLKDPFSNNDETRNFYSSFEKYDIKEWYYKLTKDLIIALEPIYEFVDFTLLYQLFYKVSQDLKQKEKHKKTIEAGGGVFDTNIHRFASEHENLINFVLKNKIMIEDFQEYRKINQLFVQITLTRQVQKERVTLSKIELYSCIKYFDYDDLLSLFKEYYYNDSPSKGKFEISDELKKWLIETVLENLITQHLSSIELFNSFESYIKNVFFILSLAKHNEEDTKLIIKQIYRILKEGKNSLSFFQSINDFIGIQANLHDIKIENKDLINMIEIFINKSIYQNFQGCESYALQYNHLSNLFNYSNKVKIEFENEELINKLFFELNEYPTSIKISFTEFLLVNFYKLSNQNIKDKIKNYALSIDIKEEKRVDIRIIFENILVIFEIKDFSDELLVKIKNYLEQFKDGSRFSSVLNTLDSQIDYLQKNKNVSELKNISEILKNIIKRFNESSRMRLF